VLICEVDIGVVCILVARWGYRLFLITNITATMITIARAATMMSAPMPPDGAGSSGNGSVVVKWQ
jgi:hypothetical protein